MKNTNAIKEMIPELNNAKRVYAMARAALETANDMVDHEIDKYRHLLETNLDADETAFYDKHDALEEQYQIEFFSKALADAEQLLVDIAKRMVILYDRNSDEVLEMFKIVDEKIGYKAIAARRKLVEITLKLNLEM